jgi:hypothetical protein
MEHGKRRQFMGQMAGLAGMMGVGGALAVAPTTAAAQTSGASRLTVPLTGTINHQPSLAGTLTIRNFAAQGNQIVASGTAALTDASNVTRVISFANTPVQLAQASCEILDLTLGPLDLTVLGLEIHLDQVHLNITANPAGGLLGQLLCSLAGLLNGGSPLQQIIALLNRILALLG